MAFCPRPRVVTIALLLSGAWVAAAEAGESRLDYNFDVRPILSDRCFVCHGPDERARKAELRLDESASAFASGAIVAGKPDESEVVRRILAHDDEQMPPKKSNLSLSRNEVDVLRRWIAEGAEYKPHWAFLPLPTSIPIPRTASLSDRPWSINSIDRFVLARLDREGLKPSPAATREEWLRRASFTLTGIPPSIREIDRFLADTKPEAFETVVDRLLDSPRFGERMAMEWLDVARYADSFGYQADGDANVWPYRDWVIRAFNQNLPYDQFISWQIAGDLIKNATTDGRLATTFSRLHRMTNEGGSIPEEWRNEYVSDRVHTFGTAFLGLTMECTRCHDHKYDPLSMRDYYGLGAFFNSIDEWGTYDSASFCPTPTLRLPTHEQERRIARLKEVVKRDEDRLAATISGREPDFRAWLLRENLKPDIPGMVSHYPLDRVETRQTLIDQVDTGKPATTATANRIVEGKLGNALQFSGDDPAEFPASSVTVERGRPFSVAFWLRMADPPTVELIFHRMAGTDTGFHGVELKFDEGRLRFGLIRFWPGDAVVVRTRSTVPGRRWVHVAVTYDGSGRASGVRLFLNGIQADHEVVRDCLTKNIEAGKSGLVFGERMRTVGLKNGSVDDLRVYSRDLAPIEVAHLADEHTLSDALRRQEVDKLRAYYLSAIDVEVVKARKRLDQTRADLFAAETGVFEIMTMAETERPRPAFILARGNYDAPRDRPIGRRTPSLLPPYPADLPRDRLGLARWLVGPDHPLTARVAVNRYWQLVFGRGIVASAENFGVQGTLPTHPELLDWLARDFVSSGWDVKALLKTLVLSSTYRQRSVATPGLRERDPDNLLLARGPSHRLPAEMLRDAALSAGGLLVEKLGGPPVKPYQPPGLWKEQNSFLPEYTPDPGEGAYRRSLYTFWRRTSPPPDMLAFDAPGREVCVVRRQSTSTPLQPLVLLNDPQFVDAAIALGERMVKEGGSTPADRLTFAFRQLTSRRPTDQELTILTNLYHQQRAPFREQPARATRFLTNSRHAIAAGDDPIDLATCGVTAGIILNLDASVSVR